MKFKYYCGIFEDAIALDFLQSKKVKYETSSYGEKNRSFFTIYSDMEGCEDFLAYIKTLPRTTIAKSSVFSKEELEKANWFLFYATRMGIDSANVAFTYNAKCLYDITSWGMKRYHHLDQINSFVSKKTPKWKTGYQFCSLEVGNRTKIFCSDYAKETIIKSGISGVDFLPVLKRDLKTETPDLSQLIFKNKLPFEAYNFIGKYEEEVCSMCGRKKYVFNEQNCHNILLNTEVIPEGIDAFGSKFEIGSGFGEEPLVISKKFYNVIFKELKEKYSHATLYPIA